MLLGLLKRIRSRKVGFMTYRHFLIVLVTAQVLSLLLLPSVSAQLIQISAFPSKFTAKPGDKILLTLYITNLENKEIEVKGFNLEVKSTHLYVLPLSFPFGKYYVPLDKPIRIGPGERKAIKEMVEVPYINYQGDLDVKVTLISNEGKAETHLEITLILTLLSASMILAYIIAAGLLSLGLYWTIKRMKSERWERKINSIDKILKRRDELIEILRALEEKRSQGKIDHSEYLDLKSSYEGDLKSTHLKLRSALPDLEMDVERLTLEINNLKEELEFLRSKLANEMEDNEMKSRLEHIETIIKSREKILGDMRERVRRVKNCI